MKTTTDFDGNTAAACCEDAESIVWRQDDFVTVEGPSWRIPLDRRATDDPQWVEVAFCPWCGTKLTPPDVEESTP